MKSTIAIVALAALTVHLSNALEADKVDCSQFTSVVDDLGSAQAITTLSDKHKLPANKEELEKKCATSLEAIKTLRKYNKECNSALTQQVFSALLRTRNQMLEDTCKTPEGISTVYNAIKCLKDNDLAPITEAEKKTVLMSQQLLEADVKDEKERIKRACCGVIAARKLFMDATKDKCAAHEKMYSQYVDSYSSESLALICPDVEKMEKDGDCKQLKPLNNPATELKYVSFLNPMLKVVKTLDH